MAFVDSGMPTLVRPDQWEQVDDYTLRATLSATGQFAVYHDGLAIQRVREPDDPYGHGTHVMMTVLDSRVAAVAEGESAAVGVAPGANVVMVRALDAQGAGFYSDVIAAIDWIVAHQGEYDVRVLNLSLDGEVLAPYWVDPLGQAVMRAWASGLVVVVAAGNSGPEPMTIGVPGNVPYVITVGAIKSGRYTDSEYDELATYSSAGPTESRFVKPDVLIPASQTIAVLPKHSVLARSEGARFVEREKPEAGDHRIHQSGQYEYYKVSGTSMAAAEVSGVVALLLQQNPSLSNDQVKYRLMTTALAAGSATEAQYSVWQQGAGRVDAVGAIFGSSTERANAGLDVALDMLGNVEGAVHFLGNTENDPATAQFYLIDRGLENNRYTVWNGGSTVWNGGSTVWNGGSTVWNGGSTVWNGGSTVWNGSMIVWSGGSVVWNGGSTVWNGGSTVWNGGSTVWNGGSTVWNGNLISGGVVAE